MASWGRYYLSRKSALTLRQRELVIGRTTALCGAGYEWGIHIAFFGDKAGLDLTDETWYRLAAARTDRLAGCRTSPAPRA